MLSYCYSYFYIVMFYYKYHGHLYSLAHIIRATITIKNFIKKYIKNRY